MAARRTAGTFLPARLPPRRTRILQQEGRGALPAPLPAPAWGHCHPTATPGTASLHKLTASALEIFPPQFSTSVLWRNSPEPGLAASLCQLCHGELREGQGLGVGSFREQPGGWHRCHCHIPSSLLRGEAEQRGGRHRSCLGWQPLGTADRTAPSPVRLPQDGRELSAGTRLHPERDRVQLRSWAVMGHAREQAGHPLLRQRRGICTLPCWEGGQAGLRAGHAEGLQGMGVPGAVHPQVRAWPGVLHLPVLTLVPKVQQLPSSCGMLGNAPPNAWAAWCGGAELPRSSGSDTAVPKLRGSAALCAWVLHLEPHHGTAVFVGGGSFSLLPRQVPISLHLSLCRFLCLKIITKPLP